jgi:hypothetical protein
MNLQSSRQTRFNVWVLIAFTLVIGVTWLLRSSYSESELSTEMALTPEWRDLRARHIMRTTGDVSELILELPGWRYDDSKTLHVEAYLDTVFAAQTRNHDPDFLCRELPPSRPADVAHRLFRFFRMRIVFDLISAPFAVKMSQKPSLPQSLHSVQLVLTGNR